MRVEVAENQGRAAHAWSDLLASTADLYGLIYTEFKDYHSETASVGCDWT